MEEVKQSKNLAEESVLRLIGHLSLNTRYYGFGRYALLSQHHYDDGDIQRLIDKGLICETRILTLTDKGQQQLNKVTNNGTI